MSIAFGSMAGGAGGARARANPGRSRAAAMASEIRNRLMRRPPGLSLLTGTVQGNFHAPVLGTPGRRIVRGSRLGITEPLDVDQAGLDALCDQEVGHVLRAAQ